MLALRAGCSQMGAVTDGPADAAVYWATELDLSGYTAWAWKRIRVIASEDVGIAEPTLETVFIQLTGKDLRD